MRITKIHLKDFKRFSELTITDIPDTAKLVLLIGSNGSGKSSIFDAFDIISKPAKNVKEGKTAYYRKGRDESIKHEINLYLSTGEHLQLGKEEIPQTNLLKKFIGRSSIRIVPRIKGSNINFIDIIEEDKDAPSTFIDFDTRFDFDVTKYTNDINKALLQPTFRGESANTLKIFQESIEPFNNALKNIFGTNETTTIRVVEYETATWSSPPKLVFKKGENLVNYELLGHGEKQVVITLLNFIARKEQLENSIYFIDEMDAHLNTALQYTLLKEVVENWLPDSCQLWTASHSLGFIDYARQAKNAAIIDFDALDFDRPQLLIPEPKDNLEVYEIAVGKDLLKRIFKSMTIIFVENKDNQYYNNLGLENTIFIPEKDKNTIYHKSRTSEFSGIIDRDFLSDEEIKDIEATYTNLHILRYYSIENYMYHPDNLEEYYRSQNQQYDKEAYIDALRVEKQKAVKEITLKMMNIRNSYPCFKEPQDEKNEKRKRYESKAANITYAKKIVTLLENDELEVFYKVFPMKDRARHLSQRQNIAKSALTRTNWFKEKIEKLL